MNRPLKSKTCVVMQPTFLPWAGYFNLISMADVFVLLDDVQFEKQSWQHRNRVLVNGMPHWITVPVHRKQLTQKINTVKINNSSSWREKQVRLLEQNYSKHPEFDVLKEVLSAIADTSIEFIAELNIKIIKIICSIIGLGSTFYRSSELNINGQRSKRLISICDRFGCDVYLSPFGSKEYLRQDGAFEKSHINLFFQDYTPQNYTQKGSDEFIGYLSLFDVIANIGSDETKEYVINGTALRIDI